MLIVVAKCNITSSIIEKLNHLQWGVSNNSVDDIILENYIEFLGCDTLDYNICNKSDCTNNSISITCNLIINKISNTILDKTVTFFVLNSDIINGIAPYTYKWEYESKDFDNSGDVNVDKSILTVKANKKVELIISNIKVTITDANGCMTIKSCYITPQGMQCASNYVSCSTISNLSVITKRVSCLAPSSLLVSKK